MNYLFSLSPNFLAQIFRHTDRMTMASLTHPPTPLSMLGFNVALAKIEVGIAYAVWSALGTLVVAYIGIVSFGESINLFKIVCLALIVFGVVGLNLADDAGGH